MAWKTALASARQECALDGQRELCSTPSSAPTQSARPQGCALRRCRAASFAAAAFAALGWPSSAGADEIGFGMLASSSAVRDPDGPVSRQGAVQPFSLHYRWQRWRDGRLRAELSHSSRRFGPRAGHIAQRLRGWSAAFAYERRWRLAPDFMPWLRLSLAQRSESFTERRRFDDEGYLADALADRHSAGLALGLGASWDLSVSPRWRLSLGASARWPLHSGSRTLRLEALCFFAPRAGANPFLTSAPRAAARRRSPMPLLAGAEL